MKLSLDNLKQFLSVKNCSTFILSSSNLPNFKDKSNVSFRFDFSVMTPGYSCNTVALIGESCKLFFNGVEHIEITDETEVSVSINIVYHDPFDRAKKYKAKVLAIKEIKNNET